MGRLIRAATLGVTCALGAAAPAAAHGVASQIGFDVHRVLGHGTTKARGDLYRVPIDEGPALLTHGPDLRLGDRGAMRFATTATERDPVCSSGYTQHILYGRISGDTNRVSTYAPQIRATVRRSDATLNQDSLDSGGPTADYKVLCDGSGEIRVDAFTAPGSSFSSVVNAARSAGYDDPGSDYTIFFDASGGNACGVGSYADDERLTAGNASNSGGGYAVVYDGCWTNETMMHENGHNQGAVQYGAPYSTGDGGHCYDEQDVMCYSPDGGDKHQRGTISRCTDRVHFDCGYDSYFDSAPEPSEYLATHWNVGSPLNRFIAFGEVPPTDPPDPGSTTVVTLANDVAASGMSATTGGWRYFKIRVPSGQSTLRVRLSGPSCLSSPCDPDLDLYLRPGAKPTESQKTCAPLLDGSSESCATAFPDRGPWYLGVRAYEATIATGFTVKAKYSTR